MILMSDLSCPGLGSDSAIRFSGYHGGEGGDGQQQPGQRDENCQKPHLFRSHADNRRRNQHPAMADERDCRDGGTGIGTSMSPGG